VKFFIDTANIEEIEAALDMGILDGVTTNPSLVSKEVTGLDEARAHLKRICDLVEDRPVSLEAVSEKYEDMVAEARDLASLADNAVIKVPMTVDGIKTVNALVPEGIDFNVTLVFSPLQVLMAAKVGAAYVSPFIGRLDDVGHDGMELIAQAMEIIGNYGYDTEVLVASIRHPMHVVRAAMMGADVATIPYKVIAQMVKHPLTDVGIDKFLADWKKVSG
jgi:transaldolase